MRPKGCSLSAVEEGRSNLGGIADVAGEMATASTSPPAASRRHVSSHRPSASLPLSLSLPRSSSQLYDDYTTRKSSFRASLPAQFVPMGYWDFQNDTPRMQQRLSNAVSISTDRSSFESRFDRSVSLGSVGSSARTSVDSNIPKTHSPAIPLRDTSWNESYVPERLPPTSRPSQLMRPQRLTAWTSAPQLGNYPGEAFKKLPKEVLMLIADALASLHLNGKVGSETCATCCMRDLCNLSMTCRKWAAAVKPRLYGSIWLVGPDSLTHIKKKFKMKAGSRLKLLRRTLRGNPFLARHVKELKVPELDPTTTKRETDHYLDLVASIIMSCPNFERLLGLYPAYNHEFSRLVHALSTRTKLAEHVWNIRPSPYQHQRRPSKGGASSGTLSVPLHPDEASEFLCYHSNWDHLATFAIQCHPGGTVDPHLLSDVVARLPALKHLALSSLPSISSNLLDSLPPLKSLHLANLPNLHNYDLSTYARSPAAQSLTSLTLIDINVTSLTTLARIFSNLNSLEKFTIKQDHSPNLPLGTSIFLHPYIACQSLRHLTWDILTPNEDDPQNDSTVILAKAIRAQGFPSLRVLKAPGDHDGLLQCLCRPSERHASSYESGTWKPGSLMDLIDERRKDTDIELSDSGYGSSYGGEYSRSLRQARLAAQQRIEHAKSRPKISIIAEDWTNSQQGTDQIFVTARYEVGAYIGMVGSKIQYCLEAEIEGRDELGMTVGDLIDYTALEGGSSNASMRTELSARRGYCDGRWNVCCDGGKGVWEHRERAKWAPFDVGVLF